MFIAIFSLTAWLMKKSVNNESVENTIIFIFCVSLFFDNIIFYEDIQRLILFI